MVKRILHTTFLLFLTLSFGFSQTAEKTLVKSFNLQGKQIVELDLDGPVQVKTWKNDILRVQMSVALTNGSSTILKSLVQVGRYNLKSSIEEEVFSIFLPGLERSVKVRGTLLEEQISFLVFAPEYIEIKLSGSATSHSGPATSF